MLKFVFTPQSGNDVNAIPSVLAGRWRLCFLHLSAAFIRDFHYRLGRCRKRQNYFQSNVTFRNQTKNESVFCYVDE